MLLTAGQNISHELDVTLIVSIAVILSKKKCLQLTEDVWQLTVSSFKCVKSEQTFRQIVLKPIFNNIFYHIIITLCETAYCLK